MIIHPGSSLPLLYNAGRIFTYAWLGAIFGMIGMSVAFFGYQQWLSVILGIVIILFIVIPKKHFVSSGSNTLIRFFENIRSSLGKLFSKRNYHSVFFIGLLNGLLPCGLIYIAIAGAVSTASVIKSSLFMAAFGLGTLPVMWSIAFFGSSINMNIRMKIRKMYPYVMLLMAILLIIRGLGLDIPYLSPDMNQDHSGVKEEIICHD